MPLPPVSKPNPGRAPDRARLVVDLDQPPHRVGMRSCWVALRGECQGVRERNRVNARSRLRVAHGDDRLEQGRINEAAGALCSPDPRPDGAAEKRRGGHLGPRILVERRQLTLPAKAREGRLEPLDEDPAELGGVVRGRRAGKRLPDQQANLAAHRIECEVVEAHDEEVVTGAGAAADPEDE